MAAEQQKRVGRYRIDLYLPDYKIAIEVDEYGHRDRDPKYEEYRESFLKRTLGCKFFRVNPDAADFNICKICGKLASMILDSPISMIAVSLDSRRRGVRRNHLKCN